MQASGLQAGGSNAAAAVQAAEAAAATASTCGPAQSCPRVPTSPCRRLPAAAQSHWSQQLAAGAAVAYVRAPGAPYHDPNVQLSTLAAAIRRACISAVKQLGKAAAAGGRTITRLCLRLPSRDAVLSPQLLEATCQAFPDLSELQVTPAAILGKQDAWLAALRQLPPSLERMSWGMHMCEEVEPGPSFTCPTQLLGEATQLARLTSLHIHAHGASWMKTHHLIPISHTLRELDLEGSDVEHLGGWALCISYTVAGMWFVNVAMCTGADVGYVSCGRCQAVVLDGRGSDSANGRLYPSGIHQKYIVSCCPLLLAQPATPCCALNYFGQCICYPPAHPAWTTQHGAV